jgi:hypothetical protein
MMSALVLEAVGRTSVYLSGMACRIFKGSLLIKFLFFDVAPRHQHRQHTHGGPLVNQLPVPGFFGLGINYYLIFGCWFVFLLVKLYEASYSWNLSI